MTISFVTEGRNLSPAHLEEFCRSFGLGQHLELTKGCTPTVVLKRISLPEGGVGLETFDYDPTERAHVVTKGCTVRL